MVRKRVTDCEYKSLILVRGKGVKKIYIVSHAVCPQSVCVCLSVCLFCPPVAFLQKSGILAVGVTPFSNNSVNLMNNT